MSGVDRDVCNVCNKQFESKDLEMCQYCFELICDNCCQYLFNWDKEILVCNNCSEIGIFSEYKQH